MKRKIVYGLLAALISFGLWLYVVTVVNPEWEDTFYNIPVVLENEEILQERGLMLASDAQPKVTLRLSGNRADMIKLNSSNITIRADLSRIYSAGEQSLSYSIVYPGNVPSNAFKILSQKPQQITLSIVDRKSKDVDVQVVFSGAVPEQHIAFMDKATLDYEKITVAGPTAVVDSIVVAKVEVNLEGQKETISQQYSYTFYDAEGNVVKNDHLKVNTEKVLYTLKIQQWKDISLRVDVIDGGGLKQDDCKLTMSVDTIRVAGSEKLLADLGDELVIGQIKLSQILELTETKTFTINLPENLTLLTEKNTVDVQIEIPELSTRVITVTDIVYIAPPEGMEATIITQNKEVTLRGPKAWLDLVTPRDLQIVVDLSTVSTTGTAMYKAEVIVSNPALSDLVGAVGEYNAEAAIAQK